MTLYCFPYAGAGPATYASWPQRLAPAIQVKAIRLPGRGTRSREPLIDKMQVLVEMLAHEIEPGLGHESFAMFGHSLGAFLAFEVAKIVFERSRKRPAVLIVSGAPAPHLRSPRWSTEGLSDDQMVQLLKGMDGTPAAVFEDAELRSYVLPLIRADFNLLSNYILEPTEPLNCPILVLRGDCDPDVSVEGADGWKEYTTGPVKVMSLRGGHFFIHSAEKIVLNVIKKATLLNQSTFL